VKATAAGHRDGSRREPDHGDLERESRDGTPERFTFTTPSGVEDVISRA
jgi:hypothetical protein